jgi:hypothetical protein
MAVTIVGSGSITGLSVGGLPDGVVDDGTLATPRNYKLVTANYDISTASGTQDITGFGFNPTFVIGFGAIQNVLIDTMGIAEIGVTTACVSSRGTAGQYFTNSSTLFLRFMVAAANAADGAVSSISDGVRMTWTKGGSPTGTAAIYILGFE